MQLPEVIREPDILSHHNAEPKFSDPQTSRGTLWYLICKPLRLPLRGSRHLFTPVNPPNDIIDNEQVS